MCEVQTFRPMAMEVKAAILKSFFMGISGFIITKKKETISIYV